MEPRAYDSYDFHHQGKFNSILTEVKSEPLEYEESETVRSLPEWHYPAVDIKTELPEDNNPEVILPDWSYLNPESTIESEDDEHPIALETVKREQCSVNIGAGQQLSSVDEAQLDMPVEIEDFAIKNEVGDDLPVFVDIKERNENEEMGRGKQPESISKVGNDSASADKSLFCDGDKYVSTTHCSKIKREIAHEEFQTQSHSFCTKDEAVPQSLMFHDQDHRNDEIFKQTGKEQCRVQFNCLQNTKQNIQTIHLEGKQYECQHCRKFFSEKSSMKKHVHTVHLKLKEFECEHCGQTFGQSSSMKRHVRTIHLKEKQFECQHCGKKFSQSGVMKKHVRTVHLKIKQSECHHCGKRFTQNDSMRKHVRIMHLKLKPIECQSSGIKCDEQQGMKKMQLQKKELECQYCGKKFSHNCYIKQHVQAVHLKQKQFKCQHCGKRFTENGSMRKHVRRVHLKMK